MKILILLISLLLGGCAQVAFECKGKIAITGNGSFAIGAGLGGASTNSWTIVGDCGEGFTYGRESSGGIGASRVTLPEREPK